MGVYGITIINKGPVFQCSFFVVQGNYLALLGIPDCDILQLLSINCHTLNDEQKGGQINKQPTKVQGKKKQKKLFIYCQS